MELGALLVTALIALLFGLVAVGIGSIFDKSVGNRYAWIAGGVVALLVFVVRLGVL